MNSFASRALPGLSFLAATSLAHAGPVPPQGFQTDAQYAASYAVAGVTNVSATTQKVSCYAPELTYFDKLTSAQGYPDGGMSPCRGTATTGENVGPYAQQDVSNPPMRVKDHSESDIRVDPLNPLHLIGQSKWIISAEGYNHWLGFYESFDGGQTWPVQGHVPGYEGWVDTTDPIGAFDPWGNFYSLVLPYQFYYGKSGGHRFDNGSNQINPSLPPEAIAMTVHPHVTLPGKTPVQSWITRHKGQPDFLMTAVKANSKDPDKQWLSIDTNPSSPHFGRVYAMWTLYVLSPSVIYESHSDAHPDGTHSDWSAPQILPTIPGKRWDSYMLPHVTPDGTVWTTTTNNPMQQGFASADIYLVSSKDGGETWQGPLPVKKNVDVPTYKNTTFREGIVNSFATGSSKIGGHYPLYVTYEDDSIGISNVYLTASYDSGRTWSAPIVVNDNDQENDSLQPNLHVTPNGKVAVAFYDRRLACPAQGSAEAAGSGISFDPGTAASPGKPWGRANYCISAAVQFYQPNLTPIGHNIRLSRHVWDPQLSAPHSGSISGSTTFIGDYFGIDSGGGFTYTTSTSTFNAAGENPFFHQQQVIAKLPTP